MKIDLLAIEIQILDLLSKYSKWNETELLKRRDETNQVCARLNSIHNVEA